MWKPGLIGILATLALATAAAATEPAATDPGAAAAPVAPESAAATPAPPDSLDDIPSAKPADVSRLLRKVRIRHGDDAVVIQTHLLLNAMQKGAVLATGVRVDRVEEKHGKRYLNFMLETGYVFDDSTRDRTERAQILWATIMEPTLSRLQDGLQVHKAEGLVVQMQYYHRPYRSAEELRATIHEPGTSEEARFYVLASDVDDVIRGKTTVRNLVTQTRTTIDGSELAMMPPASDATLTPGPE